MSAHAHWNGISLASMVLHGLCVCVCRLHNTIQAKQKDKQAMGQLEKRLKVEQEARANVEKQLADEKKRKKLEDATAARAVVLAAASRYRLQRYSQLFHKYICV